MLLRLCCFAKVIFLTRYWSCPTQLTRQGTICLYIPLYRFFFRCWVGLCVVSLIIRNMFNLYSIPCRHIVNNMKPFLPYHSYLCDFLVFCLDSQAVYYATDWIYHKIMALVEICMHHPSGTGTGNGALCACFLDFTQHWNTLYCGRRSVKHLAKSNDLFNNSFLVIVYN